jgi:hypothetical protein
MKFSDEQKLRELITVKPLLKERLLVEFIRWKESNPKGNTDFPEETKGDRKGNIYWLNVDCTWQK